MVPILNSIGVHAAVTGNHDYDFGVEALRERLAGWNFPWLLSNVLDIQTGEPLAGAHRSIVLEWQGLKIGLVGLVEREWLLTIPSLDCSKDITFLDYVEEGRRLARELHASGVDLVVALTHMRWPNDDALAAAVPEIQLILGGHDHDYDAEESSPHGTMIIKSGTDFREFSVIRVGLPSLPTDSQETVSSNIDSTDDGSEDTSNTSNNIAAGSDRSSDSSEGSNNDSGSSSNSNGAHKDNNGSYTSASSSSLRRKKHEAALVQQWPRPTIEYEHIQVTSAAPEDPAVASIVEQYQDLMGMRMDLPLGRSFVDIDTRFDRVRSQETNAGNLMGDIMRLGLDADAAFLNGGTIRSDQIHAAGRLCMRDFVSMLPFTDELVVLKLTGADVLAALETGVSAWPKREGRFLQVSGVSFKFDSRKPPGVRILPGSVNIAGEPLDMERQYTVATKAYLRSGKDGFDTLLQVEVVVDGQTAPRLATLVHNLLSRIEELNELHGANTDGSDIEQENNSSNGNGNGNGSSAKENSLFEQREHHEPVGGRRLRPVSEAPLPPAPCAHGFNDLFFYDEVTGQFGIAPKVEGRILNVAEEQGVVSTLGGRASSTRAAAANASTVKRF